MTRRAVVLAALVLAALVAACAAPAWVLATSSSPSVALVPLSVTGTTVAPGVGAGALVVAAAAPALAIGRRWGQRVALLGLASGGVLVALSALAALGSARAAATSAALEAVGVGTLTGDPRIAPWPWLTAGLGLLVVALAIGGAVVARGWTGPSQRFESGAVRAEQDGERGPARPSPQSEEPGESAEQDDAALWEMLSRGEDPS